LLKRFGTDFRVIVKRMASVNKGVSLMKKWIFLSGCCAVLAAPVSQAITPMALAPLAFETSQLQIAQSPLRDEQSRTVSLLEATQVRGRVLPFVIGVAAIDIALASFYWGVYVPHYANYGPAFKLP